jgi:hypothetical protein
MRPCSEQQFPIVSLFFSLGKKINTQPTARLNTTRSSSNEKQQQQQQQAELQFSSSHKSKGESN